jgi:hypothetical protein
MVNNTSQHILTVQHIHAPSMSNPFSDSAQRNLPPGRRSNPCRFRRSIDGQILSMRIRLWGTAVLYAVSTE